MVVTSVTDKGPAARAGLKAGDVIVSVGGQAVDDPNAFDYRFTTHPLGGKVDLGVVRGGKESKIAVALETAPEAPRDEILIEARSPFHGAKVANLSPALADELRLGFRDPGRGRRRYRRRRAGAAVRLPARRLAARGQRRQDRQDRATCEKVAKAGARLWRITIQRGGQQISAVFGG